MKIKYIHNNKGFTLVEALIVVMILGTIMVTMSLAVTTILADYNIGRDQAIALRQVENAGFFISKDIQMAKTVDPDVQGKFAELYCYIWDGNSMVEKRVDYLIYNGALIRSVDGAAGNQVAQYIVEADTNIVADLVVTGKYILNVKASYRGKEKTGRYESQQRVTQ